MDMNEGRRLTSRQYRLHDLLKEHRNEWLNADDIYRLMNLDLTRTWEAYSDTKKTYNRQIVEDVKQINDDDLIQTIILGDRGKGYKVANIKAEFMAYFDRETASLKRSLIRLSRKLHKASKDGQMIIPFGKYQKEIWEAFEHENG